MLTVITINETVADHLDHVVAEMRVLGAPTLRATRDECHGVIVALEGSHRVAAAAILGLTPVFVLLNDDAEVAVEDIGYDDCGFFVDGVATVAELRERIGSPMGMYSGCPMIQFAEDAE